MKRISLILLLLLLLKPSFSYSQENDRYTNLRIVPSSPNAASLGTYGIIPTNNYVGQANLTIPIYEIDLDGRKFPISLSYHTDGTRVSQEATWVGLGWTLQAGGCIIRQVQGTDDFAQNGCYNNTFAPWLDDPKFDVTNENMEKYKQFSAGDFDAEPDIFHFSAGEHSGSMFFDVKKNNRQIEAIPTIQSQEKDLKMVYNTSKSTWTLTDTEGYIYSFSTKETSHPLLKSSQFYTQETTWHNLFKYYKEPDIVTAWMLDAITSPNGGSILFKYKKEQIYTPVITTEDATMLGGVVGGAVSGGYELYAYNYSYSASKIEQYTLENITFDGGKVEFTTTDREDIESADDNKKVQKLTGIKVSDMNGKNIQTTILEYKYLLSGGPNTTKGFDDRLLLSSLYNTSGSKENNRYHFDYNTGNLPPKKSSSVDAWGFYNGASPTPNSQSLRISPSAFWPENMSSSGKAILFTEGMDRSFNEEFCKIGTLHSITYPTGGTTTFEYEPHRFETLPMMPPLRENRMVIVNNQMKPETFSNWDIIYASEPFEIDEQNPKIIIRRNHDQPHPDEQFSGTFTYSTWIEKKNGSSYSSIFTFPETDVMDTPLDDTEHKLEKGTYRIKLKVSNIDLEWPITIEAEVIGKTTVPTSRDYLGGGLRIKNIKNTDGRGNESWRKFEYLGAKMMVKPCFNSVVLIEHTGSWAGYWMDGYYHLIQSTPYIPITNMTRGNLVGYSAINESYGDKATQGFITYRYHNEPDELPELYLAGTPTVPDLLNGKLSSVDYRDKNNKLLKKEEYTYSPGLYEEVWAPKMRTYYFNTHSPSYCMQPYRLTAQSYYLTKKVTTDYYAEGNVINEENYQYNGYGLLRSTKSNKHGIEKEIQIKYPTDYTDAIALKMKEKYMIGLPVEQLELSENKVVNATKTVYKDTLNMILPKYTMKFNSTTPKLQSNYADSYVKDILFDKYTARGRLLCYIQNNQPVTFLWAYNYLYPVAKIEGALYTEVEKKVKTYINQLPTNKDNTAITVLLKSIRNGLVSTNSLVTTYLYNPLIGATEIITPNGVKTTYEYDIFNRLINVKNHNDKVMKEYKYNYKH